jgi:four helix bundle protein
MEEIRSKKQYDLEPRTQAFARAVIQFIRQLPKDMPTYEMAKQVVRSAGSVGANYIEANECLGKKDFLMKIRTCKKEAKETRYWLELLEATTGAEEIVRQKLIQEANELMKIFGAILIKSTEAKNSKS